MRSGGLSNTSIALCLSLAAFGAAWAICPAPAAAQYQAPSEKLRMTGQTVTTWSQDGEDVAQIEGPVRVELDRATLTAKQAVVWLRPDPDSRVGAKKVTVALIGDAKVEQANATRTGERIVVTADVSGKIQLRAEERSDRNASDTALYRAAQAMRAPPGGEAAAPTQPATPTQPGTPTRPVAPPINPVPGTVTPPPAIPTRPASPETGPGLPPVRPPVERPPGTVEPGLPGALPGGPVNPSGVIPGGPAAPLPPGQTAIGPAPSTTQPVAPVQFEAPDLETVDTDEGTVAIALSRGVTLRQNRPNGDYLELQADRVVLFTPLKSLRDLNKTEGTQRGSTLVTGGYLEGDVRINFQPFKTPNNEQRLTANRVYYDFSTDRAILTDAIIHTLQPKTNVPVVVRAKTVRQLAQGEYNAENVQLSTSQFAQPSFAIAAEKAYVRQDATEAGEPDRVLFRSTNNTFQAFGVPFFYWPYLTGSAASTQTPLRGIGFEHSNAFGFGAFAELGLFETLGYPPPRDLDLTYRADYYTDRGPAGGLSARYKGGSVSETAREPNSFEGSFHSYFVYDHGFDDIGRSLPRSHPDEENSTLRGEAQFEHQHYFPDGWQVQLRAGWVSDPTFLEQWFPRQFDQGLPHDVSGYVKRQVDNEAFTLLVQFQPNDLVTTSDLYQEQFEVEHLPEIGYHRIGESFLTDAGGQDHGTFFSDNTISGLHFQKTRASLAAQGFFPPNVSPGIPSLGTTGTTNDTIVRGDFRQEFDFPFQAGQFKVVPYVVGRYTVYSDSPDDGAKNRLFGAAGARVSTAFWKTDDTVESDIFDLHRLRHVIEPELNLFTSAQTVDRGEVFIYDEQVDPINDVSAVSIALRQRWQTYRGGPGRWRSVDFFTLGVEANFFSNQPTRDQLTPGGFRGLYFPSLPETSVPRDSVNVDASWRISDSMVVLADVSENIDHRTRLATANIGLVARRDEHLTYYLGNRFIADLGSNITTAAIEYELSKKYTIQLAQSFDFGTSQNVASEIGFVRRFDSFLFVVKATRNETTDQTSFGFNIIPYGFGYGLDSGQFESILTRSR